MKENKGITLVALIITIIVMMILVGVSVSMLINSDLLGTAKNAGIKFRDNMDAEQSFGTGSIKIAGESGEKTWDEYMQSICNHEFGEWVVVSEPESIYVDGERYRDCEKCGIRQTETIKMNECEEEAHTYGEYIIDVAATCQEKGEQHKICSTCGKKVTEEIAVDTVNGHNYTGATCIAKATCTICGGKGDFAEHTYENEECSVCGFVLSSLSAADFASKSSSFKKLYYGKTVDYGVNYGDKSEDGHGTTKNAWEIFYIGSSPTNPTQNNIYLITRGYLSKSTLLYSSYNGTSDFVDAEGNVVLNETKYLAVAAGWLNKTYDPTAETKLLYSSTNKNMKSIQYLLDSTVTKWSGLKNEKADWVIGGPTLEMFIASYNDYYDTNLEVSVPGVGSIGYTVPEGLEDSKLRGIYLNHPTTWNGEPSSYFLACPVNRTGTASVGVVSASDGVFGNSAMSSSHYGPSSFRPLVCLSSDVQITWNEAEGQFDLSLPTTQ